MTERIDGGSVVGLVPWTYCKRNTGSCWFSGASLFSLRHISDCLGASPTVRPGYFSAISSWRMCNSLVLEVLMTQCDLNWGILIKSILIKIIMWAIKQQLCYYHLIFYYNKCHQISLLRSLVRIKNTFTCLSFLYCCAQIGYLSLLRSILQNTEEGLHIWTSGTSP